MEKLIKVTQKDIDHALKLRAWRKLVKGPDVEFLSARNCCPIHQAIRRVTGRVDFLILLYCASFKNTGMSDGNVKLPDNVTKRIEIFDEQGIMKPFEFYLNIPKQW